MGRLRKYFNEADKQEQKKVQNKKQKHKTTEIIISIEIKKN